jgi:ABC-2 type transport system permease protein
MRAALVIAARVLRQRLRDRSAIIFAVVTPLGLALAFSVLIPNEFSSFRTRFVVVNHDGGPVASVLVNDVIGGLVQAGVVDVSTLGNDAAAAAEVRAGTAGAGITIPPD